MADKLLELVDVCKRGEQSPTMQAHEMFKLAGFRERPAPLDSPPGSPFAALGLGIWRAVMAERAQVFPRGRRHIFWLVVTRTV